MGDIAMYHLWQRANRLAEIYAVDPTLSTVRLRTGDGRLALAILWQENPGDIVTGVPLLDIRPFAPADQNAVIALWDACALLRPWNDPASDIALNMATPGSCLFVASGGAENGIDTLWATIMCGSDGHRGWLYYLAVDPSMRRVGIARRMVSHAEDWLAGQGIRKVELMIRPENKAVRAFYERVGYEVEPRLVMSRRLPDDDRRR